MMGNIQTKKFDRVLGFLYIVAQFAGAFVGMFLATIFKSGWDQKIELDVKGEDYIKQIIVEVMGSFFLVFMYLSSTEEKTQFTKDAAVQTIILAGSYLGAMLLAGIKLTVIKASPVNPAIAFAILIWNSSASNW